MTVQRIPFVYGRPITHEEDSVDREDEKRSIRSDDGGFGRCHLVQAVPTV